MKEVGDGLDIMLVVLAMSIMMTTCAWCLFTLRRNLDVPVAEKMVASNDIGLEIVKPIQTAKDALMMLLVCDAFVPAPAAVEFIEGSEAHTVRFLTEFYQDKEAALNKAWAEFFKDRMDRTIVSISLNETGTKWIIKLVAP